MRAAKRRGTKTVKTYRIIIYPAFKSNSSE